MISDARNFINQAMEDKDLRGKLVRADTNDQRELILVEEGFDFSFAEFDEAYHSELASSQTPQRADDLAQLRVWWEMLLQS